MICLSVEFKTVQSDEFVRHQLADGVGPTDETALNSSLSKSCIYNFVFDEP